MCGIIGYITKNKNKIEKTIINDLKKLEYRGYDSAGIAVTSNGKMLVTKSEGCISNLEQKINNEIMSNCGIAHTRWATHGAPTEINAHPHISSNRKWAIVHNGIIENYARLKQSLIEQNIAFVSDTDSEIVAQMLSQNNESNNINKLINVCSKLSGSYALACLNIDLPNTIYLAKNKSPLYIAINSDEVLISSDPITFSDRVDSYFEMYDNEFCEASIDSLTFYNNQGHIIEKNPTAIDYAATNIDLHKYSHYMIKEIHETSSVIQNICEKYTARNLFDWLDNIDTSTISQVVFIGCGTAYHAGLMGARMIEKYSRIPSSAHIASEYRYSNPIIDPHALYIFVSQSGETADTLASHQLVKEHGATTIALTNVLYSSLAKVADIILPVLAGPEIAVASTKAYTAQISILLILAKHIARQKGMCKTLNIDALKSMNIDYEYISSAAEKLAEEIYTAEKIFFLGRDTDYITATEASLKLKEITYINSASHPTGELKHGFLALVDHETYVIIVATQKELLDKTLNGAAESYSRGGKIVLISTFDLDKSKVEGYNFIKLPSCKEELSPIVAIIFFQTLAYLTSIKRGINPDKPRNLAKSVTVE